MATPPEWFADDGQPAQAIAARWIAALDAVRNTCSSSIDHYQPDHLHHGEGPEEVGLVADNAREGLLAIRHAVLFAANLSSGSQQEGNDHHEGSKMRHLHRARSYGPLPESESIDDAIVDPQPPHDLQAPSLQLALTAAMRMMAKETRDVTTESTATLVRAELRTLSAQQEELFLTLQRFISEKCGELARGESRDRNGSSSYRSAAHVESTLPQGDDSGGSSRPSTEAAHLSSVPASASPPRSACRGMVPRRNVDGFGDAQDDEGANDGVVPLLVRGPTPPANENPRSVARSSGREVAHGRSATAVVTPSRSPSPVVVVACDCPPPDMVTHPVGERCLRGGRGATPVCGHFADAPVLPVLRGHEAAETKTIMVV